MLRQKAQQKCERVKKFQKVMLRFLAQQSAKGLIIKLSQRKNKNKELFSFYTPLYTP